MTVLVELALNGIVDFIVELLAWGTCGYFFFRLVGVREQRWYWDALVVTTILLLWHVWTNAFLTELNISFGNQEFLDLFDNDVTGLFDTTFVDVLIALAEVFLGYLLGIYVMKRLRERIASES